MNTDTTCIRGCRLRLLYTGSQRRRRGRLLLLLLLPVVERPLDGESTSVTTAPPQRVALASNRLVTGLWLRRRPQWSARAPRYGRYVLGPFVQSNRVAHASIVQLVCLNLRHRLYDSYELVRVRGIFYWSRQLDFISDVLTICHSTLTPISR